MDIKTQIVWLRCFDDDELDRRVADRCADSLEKLLAVYEAANGVAINEGAARELAVKILIDVLAEVQTSEQDKRPYKERFPEQYCVNCGQWMCGGTACCGNPKSPEKP